MQINDDSIFFYYNLNRYIVGIIVCALLAVFSVLAAIGSKDYRFVAIAGVAWFSFFVCKNAIALFKATRNRQPLIILKKREIIIQGCQPLAFSDIHGIGKKRIDFGSSRLFYVCLQTDESKFELTNNQKDDTAVGLTAFCFRPSLLKRKDADFLIKEILKEIKQK